MLDYIPIREGATYSRNEWVHEFKLLEDEKNFIDCLVKGRVLIQKRRNDESENLDDDDISEANDKDNLIFNYVGIIVKNNKVIFGYPKYMKNVPDDNRLQTILKVLQKYKNSQNRLVKIYDEPDAEGQYNPLELWLYLLQDYFEYGLYSNDKEIIETNGKGKILWNQTINHKFPIIQDSVPYYFELITRKRTDDEDNFIRKLHECILTECSEKLGKVSDFFGLPKIKLTTETLADFGNKDFLNYMIDKELNIQFYTRKINLLKAMATFINQSEQKNKADLFYAYGTKNFNLVWEDVCKSIYKNQLNMSLKEILRTEILEGLKGFKERADSILIKLIDKSVWMLDDIKKYDAEETLEPDIVNLKEMNDHIEFNIYDAKYYTIKTENTNIKGNPGISDVTKQYLYQLAYQTFIKALGKLKKVQVRNAFVLPKEKDYEEPINKVSLKFLSDIGLKEIDVIHIDDQKAYNAYLKNACLEQNK